MKSRKYLDLKELCWRFGLPREVIRDWIKNGQIPFKRIGRKIRFNIKGIKEWEAQTKIFYEGKVTMGDNPETQIIWTRDSLIQKNRDSSQGARNG